MLKIQKKVKKLMLVLAILMPVIIIREKAIEIIETAETAKASKDGKSDEYTEINIAWVLCI